MNQSEDEHRHRMQCLARHVLGMRKSNGDYGPMKRWLAKQERMHGAKWADELKTYLRIEQNKRDIELQKQLHREAA